VLENIMLPSAAVNCFDMAIASLYGVLLESAKSQHHVIRCGTKQLNLLTRPYHVMPLNSHSLQAQSPRGD
jgi:hypothetical protein